MLLTSLRLAIHALNRHKLRTALTMLGLIFGVGAVVTMVALGHGAEQTVGEDVRAAGTTLIHVNAGNYTRGGEESNIATGLGAATTLTPADAEAIGHLTGVRRVAAGVKLRAWMTNGAGRFYGQILGTDVPFPQMHAWTFPRRHRFFTGAEVASRARVAVLGRTVAERLFGRATAIGQSLAIRDRSFTIVGVTNTSDEDQVETAFVPYTALQDLLDISYLHTVAVEAAQAGEATRVAADVAALLRGRHRPHIDAAMERLRAAGLTGNMMPRNGTGGALVPDDFTVKTQAAEALTKGLYTSVAAFILANMPKLDAVNLEEMTGTLERAGATMTALLAGTAAISLIIGGIGIMNVMLVSVTERTREIGIRRAAGARRRDVLVQFLVEAITISLAGGTIGIVCGIAASVALTRLLEWPTSVSVAAVLLAFAIAAAVGVFFGFYPARRASRLDPIDALRYE